MYSTAKKHHLFDSASRYCIEVNTCWTKYSWLSLWYTLFWFSSSDGSQKGRMGCYWHLCWPCLMSAREAGTLVRKEQTPLACNCLPTPPKETPTADVIFMDQLFSSPEDAAIVPAAKGATLANCVCGNDNSPQSLSWVQSKTGFNHNFWLTYQYLVGEISLPMLKMQGVTAG